MSLLISDAYRDMNVALHSSAPSYGCSGLKWAQHVRGLIRAYEAINVLDYGCGKDTLGRVLRADGTKVQSYDPAMTEFCAPPEPADLVLATDVLEHLEPDYLDLVLDHMMGLTRKAFFAVVSTRAAQKRLPDGRNAHLIVEQREWWMEHLKKRWDIRIEHESEPGREFWIVGTPR